MSSLRIHRIKALLVCWQAHQYQPFARIRELIAAALAAVGKRRAPAAAARSWPRQLTQATHPCPVRLSHEHPSRPSTRRSTPHLQTASQP